MLARKLWLLLIELLHLALAVHVDTESDQSSRNEKCKYNLKSL